MQSELTFHHIVDGISALVAVLTPDGAVEFVNQQADFLAAVQVIVYAGAIVILFLFVIMLLGVDRQENIAADPLKGQGPIGLIALQYPVIGVHPSL